MRIKREFIDSLLQQVDLVDLVNAHVPLKKAGKEHIACCPFHAEKSPSFKVNPVKEIYTCFGCGESGGAVKFIETYHQVGFVEAIAIIAKHVGVDVECERNGKRNATPSDFKDQARLIETLQRLFEAGRQSAKFQSTLKSLGIDNQVAIHAGMGLTRGLKDLNSVIDRLPHFAKLAGSMGILSQERRLLIKHDAISVPITSARGQAIGISTYREGDTSFVPVSRSIDRRNHLFFYQHPGPVKVDTIVVAPTPVDALRFASLGVGRVAAPLTKQPTLSKTQLRRLQQMTGSVIIALPHHKEGKASARSTLESWSKVVSGQLHTSFCFYKELDTLLCELQALGPSALPALKRSSIGALDLMTKLFAQDQDASIKLLQNLDRPDASARRVCAARAFAENGLEIPIELLSVMDEKQLNSKPEVPVNHLDEEQFTEAVLAFMVSLNTSRIKADPLLHEQLQQLEPQTTENGLLHHLLLALNTPGVECAGDLHSKLSNDNIKALNEVAAVVMSTDATLDLESTMAEFLAQKSLQEQALKMV